VRREHGEAVSLRAECAGSALVLTPPPERRVSPAFRKTCASEQLAEPATISARELTFNTCCVRRLDSLAREQDAREYGRLVRDVVPAAQEAGVLPTTKLQLGMGVHMGVTMGLGWLLGFYAGRAIESEGRGEIWVKIEGVKGWGQGMGSKVEMEGSG